MVARGRRIGKALPLPTYVCFHHEKTTTISERMLELGADERLFWVGVSDVFFSLGCDYFPAGQVMQLNDLCGHSGS